MDVRFGLLLIALPGVLSGQAMVEAAVGAARAAASIAPAAKTGKAVSGVFQNLSHTLDNQGKPKAAKQSGAPTAARSVKAVSVQPKSAAATPEVAFEHPSSIQSGMEYAELVRRFGPPSLSVTSDAGEETLSYIRKDVTVDVTIRAGKVTAVQKTGGSGGS